MINENRIVQEFLKYVQIPSITKKEGKFASFLIEELKKIGLEIYIDDAGKRVGSDTGNVIGKLKGTKDAPPLLFCCHMDTVVPGEGIKPMIDDGIIYSDKSTILGGDNKGGIAIIIEVLRVLKERKIDHGPIEVVFTIAEEGGLMGAKNLDYKKIESKYGFILDSGGRPGEIIIKGPAQDKIDVKIIGKPAHAGIEPQEGISAIQVAARAIHNMGLLRIDNETTANIGIIQGGRATNIVCPEVKIQGEARSLKNEKLEKQTNHMVECFKRAGKDFGARVDVQVTRMYDAFSIDEKDEIVEIVKRAAHSIGISPYTDTSGGGSDTNILNHNKIRALNLGIGEKKPHTLEEHLAIEDLINGSKLVLEIIKTI